MPGAPERQGANNDHKYAILEEWRLARRKHDCKQGLQTIVEHRSASSAGSFWRRCPKIALLGAGWVLEDQKGTLGMAKNNARIALPLPTETFENEDTSATQQFESKVEQGTRKNQFPSAVL